MLVVAEFLRGDIVFYCVLSVFVDISHSLISVLLFCIKYHASLYDREIGVILYVSIAIH